MAYIFTILFGLTPLYLLRFKIFGIPTTAFEMLLYVAFCGVLVDVFRKHHIREFVFLPEEKLFRIGFFLLSHFLLIFVIVHEGT